jgi:hypothetical protein
LSLRQAVHRFLEGTRAPELLLDDLRTLLEAALIQSFVKMMYQDTADMISKMISVCDRPDRLQPRALRGRTDWFLQWSEQQWVP